jgi:hypothetical protein
LRLKPLAILLILFCGACAWGLPDQADALQELAEAERAVERVLASAAIDPVGVWQIEIDDTESCRCPECGARVAMLGLGEHDQETFFASVATAAETVDGEVEPPQLYGRAWIAAVRVDGLPMLEFLWEQGSAKAYIDSGCYIRDNP